MRTKLLIVLILLSKLVFAGHCKGHFINPVKDVCWRCLFPLSIGNVQVVSSDLPDTENASNPIQVCPATVGSRVGINMGYWEPSALVEVTDTPYCLVNLGGMQLPMKAQNQGGAQWIEEGQQRAFYHAHWYKYPLMTWLNLITSAGCHQVGDFELAYMTELDPTWNDSQMSFVLNPDAILFANPVASASCAADSLSSTFQNKPLDSLFWCAGAQGSLYPFTGFIHAAMSPVQASLLLAERLNYKLHREHLIADSTPLAPCQEHYFSTLPKSRYRYEMVNQVADGKHCYPTGHSTLPWESGKIKPHTGAHYGYLVWRKRNCAFI